jgi:hypothetical protein
MLILVLLLAAASSLVVGVLVDGPWFTAAALALALISGGVLAFRLVRQRRQARAEAPVDDAPVEQVTAEEAPVEQAPVEEPTPEPAPAEEAAPEPAALRSVPAEAPTATEPPDDVEVVRVVPGRRRYHRADCALVEGLSYEEIVPEEAAQEGFTPCTRCLSPERLAVG